MKRRSAGSFWLLHNALYTENSFFTPEGRMTDVAPLKTEIYQIIEPYASTSVPKKISNIIELLKITAHIDDFPPQTDRIHVANGTLFLDGSFSESKSEIVRNRFPVAYNPSAPSPETWLGFLSNLLYDDDIPTLRNTSATACPQQQGTALRSSRARRRGRRSRHRPVPSVWLQCQGRRVGMVSENRFARADLGAHPSADRR